MTLFEHLACVQASPRIDIVDAVTLANINEVDVCQLCLTQRQIQKSVSDTDLVSDTGFCVRHRANTAPGLCQPQPQAKPAPAFCGDFGKIARLRPLRGRLVSTGF